MILCATILVASCKFELPIPDVIPNPAFGVSGLQRIPTVTIYETTDVDIELSRTYGLSKEITLDLAVDESLVNEYNRLYSSSYKVMDAKYYEVPALHQHSYYDLQFAHGLNCVKQVRIC